MRNFASLLRREAARLQESHSPSPALPAAGPAPETIMSAQQPRRVENLHTDKGKVPVYATGIVEQPWDEYAAEDHATWATLFARQREILVGRASEAFLRAQDTMGMTPGRIPKFSCQNLSDRSFRPRSRISVFVGLASVSRYPVSGFPAGHRVGS